MHNKTQSLVQSAGAHYSFPFEKGAGLIEVMVSLLVLAIGLLGAVSLQSNGLNSNQRAVFVSEAHILAQDMADRILAYGSSEYNGSAGANNGEYGSTNTKTGTYIDPGCAASGCDPDETVALDRYEWQQLFIYSNNNTVSLPSAYGAVSWNDPTYTITIYWDQDRTGATGTDCNSNDKSETGNLTCFQMQVAL